MTAPSSWFPCCCPVAGYSGGPLGSSLPSGSGSSSPLGEPCIHCEEGTTHRKYQVEISGVAAGGLCTGGCDLYNGTYILDQCWHRALTHPDECATGGGEPASECAWAIGWEHGSVCTCDDGFFCMEHRDWIRLTLDTEITVIVQGDFNERLRFQEARTDGASCRYEQKDVPLLNEGTQCDVSAVTCTLTAIA